MTSTLPAPVRPAARTIPRLRWVLAAILMLVSVVNYLDRQTLSILARTIQDDLGISDRQYGFIVQAFLLTYLVMHVVSGRIVDALGPRVAETLFICWWSCANVLTGFARGFWSLAANRMLLGMGEPGHYSAAGKAVSEWFPAREKGIAVGMYVMGGTLGAAIAAPLLAWVAIRFDWRSAFVLTGLVGLVPAALWYALYRRPSEHPRLSLRERLLTETGDLPAKTTPLPWRQVLRLRAAWPVMLARMITDPLWLFYLFWFPKYLQDARHFTLAEVGMWAWTLYVAADIGALAGGWLSGLLIRRGMRAPKARLVVLAGAACLLAGSFCVPLLPGRHPVLLAASVFTFSEMVWMTNCVTLPLDVVPAAAVGAVQGVIGAAGSFGGLLSAGAVGWLVTHVSYGPVFLLMSFLHPAAFLILFLTLRRESFNSNERH